MALPEANYEMTDMALGQNARYAGDNHLWVKFHILPMVDEAKSAEEGRPVFVDKEHIRIMMPGNKESVIDRPVTEMDKHRFRAQYAKWKTDEKELLEGTLLESVAKDPLLRLTLSQVEELKFFHIRTVEQLAELSDVHAQKFMGINMLKKAARNYLEKAKENAVTTRLEAELDQRDNEIASLKQAVADLQKMVAEGQAEAATPKRSRPPKVA